MLHSLLCKACDVVSCVNSLPDDIVSYNFWIMLLYDLNCHAFRHVDFDDAGLRTDPFADLQTGR
jgi:hypothetical protein